MDVTSGQSEDHPSDDATDDQPAAAAADTSGGSPRPAFTTESVTTDDNESRNAPSADPAVAALLDAATRGDLSRPDQPADVLQYGQDALRAAVHVKPVADTQPILDPDHLQYQAIVRKAVLDEVSAHADEFPGVEVCGVFIGTVYENPQASFVYIENMIRGEASSGRSTAVTFTAETWQHIHRVMEEKYPGKRILAWYHTHPGFGIFLSEMDLFIQRHFFNAPWQMAFVFDPQSRESGMFAWRQAQVRRVDYVVDDEAAPRPEPSAFPALPYLSSPEPHEEAVPESRQTRDELVQRIDVLEARVRMLSVGFAILLAVAIIWPLVMPLFLSSREGNPATMPAGPTPGDTQRETTPILPLPSR